MHADKRTHTHTHTHRGLLLGSLIASLYMGVLLKNTETSHLYTYSDGTNTHTHAFDTVKVK